MSGVNNPYRYQYEHVAASATAQVLGTTGAVGDYIHRLVCTVTTGATGAHHRNTGARQPIDVAEPKQNGRRVIVVGEFFWERGRPSKHHADTGFDMRVPIRLRIDRSCYGTPLIAKRLRKSKPGTARSRTGRQLVRE